MRTRGYLYRASAAWVVGMALTATPAMAQTEPAPVAVGVSLEPGIVPGHDDGFDAHAGASVSCGREVREVESPAGPTGPARGTQ